MQIAQNSQVAVQVVAAFDIEHRSHLALGADALNIVGIVCLVLGCVWILQGVNVLPGSFMSGQSKWAINGSILAIVAIALMVWANRRRI